MAPNTRNQAKANVSLDDLLSKKRRQDAGALASQIMGKQARRTLAGPAPKQRAAAASTAPKASSSGQWTHDLHHTTNSLASRITKPRKSTAASARSTRSPPPTIPKVTHAAARNLKNNRLFTALHSDQTKIHPAPTPAAPKNTPSAPRNAPSGPSSSEFSIRGAAGPAVLQATNFAPGTTAEDIKHAMLPLGEILSCLVLTAAPTVIAEIVFRERDAAEKCIAQYNGQRADGRILQVTYKAGAPVARIQAPKNEDPYAVREEADRLRKERNMHAVQDGRFGVSPPVYSAPLYSDALLMKGRGFAGRSS